VRRRAAVIAAIALSGLPAAVLWWWLAEPARWRATERGLVLTEQQATGAFQVVAMFTIIGAVLGLVAGVVTWWLTSPARWQTPVALGLAAAIAAVLCWRVGTWIGPGPVREAAGLDPGDTVEAPLAVDSVVPFLVWPLVAVLAYTVALYVSADHDADREPDEEPRTEQLSERSSP